MWRTVVNGLLDLLWPPRTQCLLCQGPANLPALDNPVCHTCWESMLFPSDVHLCFNCTRPLEGAGDLCEECADGSPYGYVYAIGLHEGALREAIHHLKFGGREELAPPLGRKLAPLISARPDCIVPVPLHRSRLAERGYNQATLIARTLSAELSVPTHDGVIARQRSTGHQAKLDRASRMRNLHGAFGLSPGARHPWTGQEVLLVDDVLTTGATAAAVAAVLHATGAASVNLAVLAVSTKRVWGKSKK